MRKSKNVFRKRLRSISKKSRNKKKGESGLASGFNLTFPHPFVNLKTLAKIKNRMEKGRERRLLTRGCSFYYIEGWKILVLNQKNAIRKYNNYKSVLT